MPNVDDPVRRYLGAFLSGDALEAALTETRAASGDSLARLHAASDAVRSRVRVSPDAEAVTLVAEAGVSPAVAAAVTGLPLGRVEALLAELADEVAAVLARDDDEPLPPTPAAVPPLDPVAVEPGPPAASSAHDAPGPSAASGGGPGGDRGGDRGGDEASDGGPVGGADADAHERGAWIAAVVVGLLLLVVGLVTILTQRGPVGLEPPPTARTETPAP